MKWWNSQLISLNTINFNNHKAVHFAQNPVNGQKLIMANSMSPDEKFTMQGDEMMKEGHFDSAINLYRQALQINPDNYDANLNLAKTYKYKNDDKSSIPYFEKSAALAPQDLEVLTLLGEAYKNSGYYDKAERQFRKVLDIDPAYDYARRNLLDTQNFKLACTDPVRAKKEREQAAIANLHQSIKLAANHFPKGYMKDLADLTVAFDKTESMGGRSNIAQYEHFKRKTTVMDDYIYASPYIVGSYLVHEFVHAKDNDPYTSVREEQDAYRTQAEFWVKNAKNIKDPEMDFVTELYNSSPQTLDKRVAEIYRLRDKNIPEMSFNHPPSNKKSAASAGLSDSSQPIKAYDVIV